MRGEVRETHSSGPSGRHKPGGQNGRRARLFGISAALAVTLGIAVASTMIGRAFPSKSAESTSKSCCGAGMATSPVAPQEQVVTAVPQGSTANPDPPGTIDGSNNPELIPDEVAYRVLMLAVAEPEDSTKEQLARAHAKIARANLSDDDETVFLVTASRFKDKVDALQAQAVQITSGFVFVDPHSVQGQQLSQLGKQQDQALDDALSTFQSRLSVSGVEKLQAHVQSIKRKMKLYPPPPNMPAF